MIKFDFNTIPIPLSGKTIIYICPNCKTEYEVPIEMVEEFEEEDMFKGLPVSTPPYTVCPKCSHKKGVPKDYKSKKDIITYIKVNNNLDIKTAGLSSCL